MRYTILVTCLHAGMASAYLQSITGQGLIGSHFGIPYFNASFDYVIVGGGTAGLTIATRLAENSSISVAVIEAGGFPDFDNGNLSAIPAYNAYWIGKSPADRNPLIDWEIYTEPIEGFNGKNMMYTQGKTLGGGSVRNSMTYQRSTIGAFQMWADQVDDQSYTFDKLMPFFEKSINFQSPDESLRPSNATLKYNARSNSDSAGPLHVSYPNWANSYSSWAKLALAELGLSESDGFLDGKLSGFQYASQTLDRETQTRSSSESSFLRAALANNSNLNIYKSTLGKRIIFDTNNQATGVIVDTAGVEYTISAQREVIICAGAFRSPQLLLVSGIGPKSQLDALHIPIVADRPGVGKNIQDHVLFTISYEVNLITHSKLQDPVFAASQVANYITNRTGILTNTAADFLGWEKLPKDLREGLSNYTRSSLDKLPADWPELELIFPDGYSGYKTDYLTNAPADGRNYASVSIGLLAPFSRGNLSINTSDTSYNPVVNPNFLGDVRDQEFAVQAFKRARQIAQTESLQSIIIGEETFPGPSVSTDEEILTFLKKSSNTIYHASASNAMGKSTDPDAVVDSEARVIGVNSLRVVDSSVFPFIPPGHPQSAVYVLAEKIADVIQRG